MHMRKFTSSVYNRDKLMGVAFDGIGSLSMATIDKFREMRASEMRAKDIAAGGFQQPSGQCETESWQLAVQSSRLISVIS